MLTVSDLPVQDRSVREVETPDGTAVIFGTPVFLYCPSCDERWSASRGDYFWKPAGEPFECGRCVEPLILAKDGSGIIEVAS